MNKTPLRFLLPAALAIALLSGASAHAEEATIYGRTMPPGAASYGGAFRPAKTGLHCYAIDVNKCWDGNAWHEIYPLGARHYGKPPAGGMVSCAVIMNDSHDCWDGANWYRLPSGTLWGNIAPLNFSEESGAFRTVPLR